MATADTIAQKLKDALSPQHITVEDVSHHHAGHAGWRDGGGTHFTVTIKAASFRGKSRVQQHRLVNDPTFVERIAHKIGYARADETIFHFPKDEESDER